MFILNINGDFFKSAFSLILSAIVFTILCGIYFVLTNSIFDYKIYIPIILLISSCIIIYVVYLDDNKEKEKYILECFCQKKKKNLISNFNGPCMTDDNTWGYIRDGKCVSSNKKCKKKQEQTNLFNLFNLNFSVLPSDSNIDDKSKPPVSKPPVSKLSESKPSVSKPPVHTLPRPTNDDFNFWCKYSNGLGFNAKSVNNVIDKPGYSTAECSKDIENNLDNYYLYTDCFKNDPSYTSGEYNNRCSNKIPGSFYDKDSIGAYNCPIGQVRYKCNIQPLDYLNYSDCFEFDPSKPFNYYNQKCSNKFSPSASYIKDSIGKYNCKNNNVRIKCDLYPNQCSS